MEQLIEFSGNHIMLVTAFIAVSAALVWNLVSNGGKNAIDAVTATGLINHEDAVVVDVRTAAEFKQGHIINAVNIPLPSLKNQLKQLEKYKGKPVIVACRSGSRSGMACRLLKTAGIENTHNLRGGMLAWESSNLPVKRST